MSHQDGSILEFIISKDKGLEIVGPIGEDYTGIFSGVDRKSTRLNSSHTDIYTLSLHDALPIYVSSRRLHIRIHNFKRQGSGDSWSHWRGLHGDFFGCRSEEHTSELQSH